MKNKTFIWQGLNFLCKYFHYFVCYASNRGISGTQSNVKSSPPFVLLQKGVLKIRSKFTEERSYRSVISVKLLSNFTETTLQHGCSPVNLLHIFKTAFPKNTSEWLLLKHKVGELNNCFCKNLHLRCLAGFWKWICQIISS